jgi:hypothetical protein
VTRSATPRCPLRQRPAPIELKRSVVWVSPILDWSKPDLNTDRRANPGPPGNEVTALLHMSLSATGEFSRR